MQNTTPHDRDLWQDGRTRDPAVRRAANECLRAWEAEHGQTLQSTSRTGAGTVFRSAEYLVLGRTSKLESLERSPGLRHWSAISPKQFERLERAAKRERKRLVFLLLSHDPLMTRYFEVPGDGVEWPRLPKRSSGVAYFKIFEGRDGLLLELKPDPLDVTTTERRVAHSEPAGAPRIPGYAELITTDPLVRGGKACVRGLRITVQDVLERLASGMPDDQVIADFPELTGQDIRACLAYAADRERRLRETVV